MSNNRLYLIVLLLSIISLSVIVPAYAEVTSLKSDSQFYKGGSKITFSGTTESIDPPNVTILIFGPNNNFVMLASAVADSNHNFQVVVDTSTPGNQQSLSVKGLYNATGFIAKKENGKTVSFVFSPDGSSVAPSSPISLTTSPQSSTEIDLNWSAPSNNGGLPISGYNIERDDGTGFKSIRNASSTSFQDIGLTPNKQYSYRVSAFNSGGTSNPSNVSTAVTLSPSFQSVPPTQTPSSTNSSSTQSLADLQKQRIANANKLQQLLNGQTQNSTSNSSQSQSLADIIKQRVENAKKLQQLTEGTQQKINLNENVKLNDLPNSLQAGVSGNSNNASPINFGNFDVKNIIYLIVAIVGVVIVIAILYSRKKNTPSTTKIQKEIVVPPDKPTSADLEDDYAVMILKNRLAKGEISVEEFKTLKNELSEF